ncbi:hypothetical protein [Acinetobacter nosocomialis]|uniref:hypothetical protein n=1 Tax=Acinetobacter nosocomialis TaxID=106654 RepID=UPI0033A30287
MSNYKTLATNDNERIEIESLYGELGYKGKFSLLSYPSFIFAKALDDDFDNQKALFASVFDPEICKEISIDQLKSLVELHNEAKDAFLQEADRLGHNPYWDNKSGQPLDIGLRLHWNWFWVAFQHRQDKVKAFKKESLQLQIHLLEVQQNLQDASELQKRITDSIFILSTIDNPDEAYKAIDFLLRALRGSKND